MRVVWVVAGHIGAQTYERSTIFRIRIYDKNPPILNTAWNEQKRVVDLNDKSYVFITSLTSSPWRDREKFPNANRSTILYYWSKYGDKRIKRSLNWTPDPRSWWPTGITQSLVFNETYVKGFKF